MGSTDAINSTKRAEDAADERKTMRPQRTRSKTQPARKLEEQQPQDEEEEEEEGNEGRVGSETQT